MTGQIATDVRPETCVRITGLSVAYVVGGRRARVVHGVDLSIRRGATLALVGESGSGKTTVAKALLRLVEPEAGRIEVAGADLPCLSNNELRRFRRRMQVVFQDAGGSLTPTMTVAGLLRDTRAAHGRPASRDPDAWAPLLATVGLDPALATRYPHELSGGQRQRVALARALALDPELLVLDEPLSALDVPAQLQMLDLLASLKAQRHLTILLITHHLDAARRLADEVAVMYAGRIVETGPAALVLSAPAHPYTRALLAALPGLDPAQPTLAATPPAPSSSPPATGCDFSCRCPYADEICRTNRPALTPLVRKGEHVRAACHYPFNDTDRPLG